MHFHYDIIPPLPVLDDLAGFSVYLGFEHFRGAHFDDAQPGTVIEKQLIIPCLDLHPRNGANGIEDLAGRNRRLESCGTSRRPWLNPLNGFTNLQDNTGADEENEWSGNGNRYPLVGHSQHV